MNYVNILNNSQKVISPYLDSSEKDYIFECRAVVIKWDNGRKSVLVTDIPRDLLNESEITKKYFDRWHMQEKTFREAKCGVKNH